MSMSGNIHINSIGENLDEYLKPNLMWRNISEKKFTSVNHCEVPKDNYTSTQNIWAYNVNLKNE